jgi:Tfp pilus assembly protein PilF
MSRNVQSHKNTYLGIVIVFVLFSIGAYTYINSNSNDAPSSGSVLVLPITLTAEATEPWWNMYAAMDNLNHQLTLGAKFPILQTEDVISMMQLADAGSTINSTLDNSDHHVDIKRLMAISGATYIIEANITKANNGYQLTYNLHQENHQQHQQQQIIEAATVDSLMTLTAADINQQINPHNTAPPSTYHSNFDNLQLVKGLGFMQSGDWTFAQQQLTQTIAAEPENLLARRLLAGLQYQNTQYTLAKATLTSAIKHATAINNERELAKLRLLLAQTALEMTEIEPALALLSVAKTHAAKVNEWLYLGYIAQLAGVINQRLGRNEEARLQFKQAIKYHRMMRYPIGQSQSLNLLVELEIVEHNYPQAYRDIARSFELISGLGLTEMEAATLTLMAKVEDKR